MIKQQRTETPGMVSHNDGLFARAKLPWLTS